MPGSVRLLGFFWSIPGGTGPALLHPWGLVPSQDEDKLAGAVSTLWCCSPQGGWEYWDMAGAGVAPGVTSGVDGGWVDGEWILAVLLSDRTLFICPSVQAAVL